MKTEEERKRQIKSNQKQNETERNVHTLERVSCWEHIVLELEFDGQQNENEMKSQIISMNNRDENCVSERERDTPCD